MADETPGGGGSEASSRSPTLTDLAKICAELNRLGARYVVVGGLAVIQAGYSRTTEDIDLLIDASPENAARVIEALLILPDRAAAELKPDDVAQYNVIRVADEVLVDIMRSGCDVTYETAMNDALMVPVQGITIPFASPRTLWRMKQTVRAKDIPDRLYLRELLHAQGVDVQIQQNPIGRWVKRLKRWWNFR